MSPFRIHAIFLAALLVFMAALTIGPRIVPEDQNKYCVVLVDLPGPFGVTLNCDAQTFLRVASNFPEIFRSDSIRQARPGLIFVASVIAAPLRPIADFAYKIVRPSAAHPDIPSERLGPALHAFIPAYIAYLIIGVLLILATFHLFWRMAGRPGAGAGVAAVGVLAVGLLFAFNDITKGFLLSPHTQLFNIFLPVVCTWIAWRASRDDLLGDPKVFALAAAIGYGIVSYAAFVVALPALLLPAAVAQLRRPQLSRRWVELTWRGAAVCALAALPSIAWYFLVKAKSGGFNLIAVQKFRLLAWVGDTYVTAGAAGVGRLFIEKLGTMAGYATMHAFVALSVVLIVVLALANERIPIRKTLEPSAPLVFAALFVSLMFLGFYAVLGLPSPRLAYASAPPIVVAAGVIAARGLGALSGEGRRRVAWSIMVLCVFFGLWEVVKFGPYYTWGE